jgi:hypothetical protein
VLDFGHALGLLELGLWRIVFATLFLVVGWLGKVVITGIVFLVDPSWFHGAARCTGPSLAFVTSLPSRCSPCSHLAHMHTRAAGADVTRADELGASLVGARLTGSSGTQPERRILIGH